MSIVIFGVRIVQLSARKVVAQSTVRSESFGLIP